MGSKDGSGMKIAYILVVANLLLSLVTYPMLPDRIIMHWGPGGVPDGYGSKLSGTLLMQVVQFFMLGIFLAIPRIDPQKRVTASSGYFSNLINLMLAYFMFFNVLFITQNLGYNFNMTAVVMPAVGVLMFFLGDILGKAEPNWFVGLRTPWTLSNDDVWYSTHKKAGVLFKICGAISVAGVLFPVYSVWLLVGSITLTALYLVAFSYKEFQRLEG